MKKQIPAALSLIAAIALILAGMFVYSRPESGADEAAAVKNIIVESVSLENRSGRGCYVLSDASGDEYVFSRLPDSERLRSISGSGAEIRYTQKNGVKYLRSLSINGEVLLHDENARAPAFAHVIGAVIIAGGFIFLWQFVNAVTRPKKQ